MSYKRTGLDSARFLFMIYCMLCLPLFTVIFTAGMSVSTNTTVLVFAAPISTHTTYFSCPLYIFLSARIITLRCWWGVPCCSMLVDCLLVLCSFGKQSVLLGAILTITMICLWADFVSLSVFAPCYPLLLLLLAGCWNPATTITYRLGPAATTSPLLLLLLLHLPTCTPVYFHPVLNTAAVYCRKLRPTLSLPFLVRL